MCLGMMGRCERISYKDKITVASKDYVGSSIGCPRSEQMCERL